MRGSPVKSSKIVSYATTTSFALGTKDFPEMLKKLGSWIGTAKKYVNNIQDEVSNIDIDENDIKKKVDKKDES